MTSMTAATSGGSAIMLYPADGTDGISSQYGIDTQRMKKIIELHRNTPNSYVEFFKDAIRIVGDGTYLDLGTTLLDFDLDELWIEKYLEWADGDGNIKLKMEQARLSGIRLDEAGEPVFLFMPETAYFDQCAADEGKCPGDYNEDMVEECFRFDDRIREMVTPVTIDEMDYYELRDAALCIHDVLMFEVRHDPDHRFSRSKVNKLYSISHYVSFAPSYNSPGTLDSVIISKKPLDNAYASKKVRGFIRALEIRDEIYDLFIYEKHEGFRYDNGSSDIASFLLAESEKTAIIQYFKEL